MREVLFRSAAWDDEAGEIRTRKVCEDRFWKRVEEVSERSRKQVFAFQDDIW